MEKIGIAIQGEFDYVKEFELSDISALVFIGREFKHYKTQDTFNVITKDGKRYDGFGDFSYAKQMFISYHTNKISKAIETKWN